ncbi:hypothetical protein TNCT_517211, partial [Trichonephila clavata]
ASVVCHCQVVERGGRVFPELLITDDALILPTYRCTSGVDLAFPDTHITTIETIASTSTVPDSAIDFPSPRGSPNNAFQYLEGIIVAAKGTTATPYPTDTTKSYPRDTSQMERLSTPGTSAQTMETDEVSPSDAQQKCTRLYDLENQIYQESCKLTFYDQIIKGKLERFHGPSDQLPRYIKEREELQAFLTNIKGELALLFPCPFPTCHHNTSPKHLEQTSTPSANSSLANKLAETHIRGEPSNNEKAKKNLLNGFTSPSKMAKRARILQNYSVGARAPIETTNKFQSLAGRDKQPTLTDPAMPVAPPPKIPP